MGEITTIEESKKAMADIIQEQKYYSEELDAVSKSGKYVKGKYTQEIITDFVKFYAQQIFYSKRIKKNLEKIYNGIQD
jgi:hypothetical protein